MTALHPEVALFIGLQASGKTSFYTSRFIPTHVHVSIDNFPNAKNKRARVARLVTEALEAGRSVVVDNTHPTRASRSETIAIARARNARVVGYYFESRVDECVARNQARSEADRVPPVAIFSTIKELERPTLGEGFDELYFVRWITPHECTVEPWREE